jgi:hypothetical protein
MNQTVPIQNLSDESDNAEFRSHILMSSDVNVVYIILLL